MVRPPEIRISHDSQTWAFAAAELVHAVGKEAVHATGQFLIALSGGTTPETLYRTLASPAFADRFDWSRTTFFLVMNAASLRMILGATTPWPTKPCSSL